MAKGCVYIPKTGKDAGKVFGSKDSLAAHMNYTPALADVMAKYQKADGKMDVGSVTKWLTDNGYLKAEAKKPTTTGEDIKSFFSNIGNQNLAIMEADILKAGKSVISNISKATSEQRKKIDSDIEQLKNKYPERNITSRVENGNLIVESGVAAPKSTEGTKKETPGISKSEQAGLEILNKYGVQRFTDWLTNQPLLGGFFGIRDIANKYGIKFPQTEKEFDAEVKRNGGIDNYMGSMADTFMSKMKQPSVEKKPTTKKAFPKAPVTDVVKAALKSVDNTTAAIMNLAKVLPTVYESIARQVKLSLGKPASQQIAEAYHNAVENGVEPELVSAVENAVALQEQMKSKPSLSGQIETNETLEFQDVPTGTRAGNKASMDTLERKHSDNATKKAVIAAVKRAARTLKSVFPSMDIHVHEDSKQYEEAMAGLNGQKNSRGNFVYNTSSDGTTVGRIDINLSTATPRTVVHEVTHAILLKTFGDNSAAFLDFRKKIEKIISTSGNKKLSDFADQYEEIADEIGQAEEYLTELSAILSDKESPLNYGIVRKVAELINKAVSTVTFDRFQPFQDLQDQKDALEFFNTIAQSIKAGTDVSGLVTDNIFTNETPNAEGEVGVFKLKSKSSLAAPKASKDPRPWVKKFVTDVDLMKFDGRPFVTNMYDYTTAGEVTMGKHKIKLMGGKSYVPYMMHKNKKKIGQVSNLAAFNSKENAEGFIRNAIEGGASLFAPHSGTLSQSWQFQHHTFTELVNLALDKNILTNEELIGMFNNIIKSAGNKADFKQFREEYFKKSGKKINNFSSFVKNPKEIVDLLDIQNNFAPNLRKTLSSTLSANKKFQEEIGIKNKEQFYELIMDPLNAGVTGGEILGVVEFDPATFEIVKTTPGAKDHHPSFGWALMAKIEGIYQPTEFYKSYDVTDTYTKYNKGGVEVSKKSDGFNDFVSSNVKSSAGAIPKIAKFNVSGLKSKPQLEDRPLTEIDGQTTFFHASSKKREGKLKPNMAPQWGKAIYFATSRPGATDEFGGQNVTEASLSLKNPVYTNSKEFKPVQKKATELYNKAMLPKILKDETESVNGELRFFDKDLQAEYDKKGYIDRYSSSDVEEGKYFGDAARELGHDAIIDQGNQYGAEIAVLDENAVIYPEDMKPKSDLEAIEEKGGTVYHGGEIVNLKSINENEPFFVTESESEAIAYSKGNSGDVFVAKIDLSKIGNEEVARNILKKMGYSDEYMLHELIDPRFEESYIGKNNVKKLYSEIEKQGYIGISFNDTGIANKKQVTNIFLISPKETLSNSGFETNKIVNEWRSSEFLEQGYFPVIDGKIIQNPTEEELNNYFSKNEYLNMVKPSVSKGQLSLKSKAQILGLTGASRLDNAEKIMGNLEVAKKMERDFAKQPLTVGKRMSDAQKIKMATGWERGVDELWRLEIPDAKLKDFEISKLPKYMASQTRYARLGDVINAPELFKAYSVPRREGKQALEDVVVEFLDTTDFYGMFKEKQQVLQVSTNEKIHGNNDDMLSTILHEIQHYIQWVEGFEKGSTIVSLSGIPYVQLQIQKRAKGLFSAYNKLFDESNQPGADTQSINEDLRGIKFEYTKLKEEISKPVRDLYTRAAGEVEARNVQERMTLTEEERRGKLLLETEDVKRNDQLLLEEAVQTPSLKSKAQLADNNAKEVADLYAEMREGGGWTERQKINAILDRDPKLSYIYNNFKEITRMLEDAKLLTKSVNCP